MQKSEQINELAAALAKAQAKIESADKAGTNEFYKKSGGGGKYVTLTAVWDACRKCLSDNGLSVVQTTDTSENGMVLESLLLHSSGQWVSSTYPINPVRNDPQGLGSAITYARRYSLMALVGVVANDASEDDGERAVDHSREPIYHGVKPTQREAIHGPSTLKPTEGIGATNQAAAADWAMKSIAAIRLASLADLRAWQKLNTKAMEKLAATEPELHKDVTDNFNSRMEYHLEAASKAAE